MKKLHYLLFLCCLSLTIPCLTHAQVWKIYAGPGNQYGYRIRNTADGGFIVGGRSDGGINGNLEYWVSKFNNQGNPAWDSLYTLTNQSNLWSIETTKDGGSLIAGFDGSQYLDASALMFKIDSVGKIVKQLDYKDPTGAHAIHSHWLVERKTGGYFWAGHTDADNDPNGEKILMKLNNNFDSVLKADYSLHGGEHGHCGALTNDGGCVILGHTSLSGYEKFWANRVDSNGKQVWSKVFSSSSTMHDSPYDIVATREGGFAFFGGSTNQQSTVGTMWLVVVDSAGNKIFDKHFGTGFNFGWSGIQTSDGGFLIVGETTNQTAGQSDMYAAKTDGKGNLLWQKKYGTTQYEGGFGVIQRNNQYIFAGYSTYTPNGTEGLFLVTTDLNGNPVPFDPNPPASMAFGLDSTHFQYILGQDKHLYGTIENTRNDTVRMTFARTDNLPSTYEFHLNFGDQEFGPTQDTSTTPLVFAPHEKRIFYVHVIAPQQRDTGTVCVRVRVLNSEKVDTSDVCFKIYPPAPSGVVSAGLTNEAVSVFPNPVMSDHGLTVELPSEASAGARLLIYDEMGRIAYDARPIVENRDGKSLVSIQQFTSVPGSYWLKVITGSKTFNAVPFRVLK